MSEQSLSAVLVGCTGLVGSQILSTLLSLPAHPTTHAFARRALPTASPALIPHIAPDSSTWPSAISTLKPPPSIFFSAIGTTRANAGSLAAQRAIDHNLNVALASAAKEAGVRVCVLISVTGASTTSPFPYSKMKADVEDDIKGLGFAYTVIVRPGLLVGNRQESRLAEGAFRGLANLFGKVSKPWLADWWAQDVSEIGRAAVSAALQCAEGKREEGVWVVGQSEIIRLGRTEWKG